MKVLFATSEAHPLAKTGGLADVSGALPAALRDIGVEVRVLMPGYPSAKAKAENLMAVASFNLPVHGKTTLLRGTFPDNDVPVYLIDHAVYYEREGIYQNVQAQDWPDNALRFGLLSQLAARLASDEPAPDFQPDILHCNDWQTGLAPAYLHFGKTPHPPSLFTIHNLAYQGTFQPDILNGLGLPQESFSINGLEFFGNISFLKSGLFYADRITTVSPNYAREIQTDPTGMGLHGLLSTRRGVLHGILNGIDMTEWNPATDPHLKAHYTWKAHAGKALVKQALQGELGLDCKPRAPLLSMVSRLTEQKGSDVVIESAPQLVEMGVQIAVLGSGNKQMESAWQALAKTYPGRIAVVIGYNEGLAHRVEAGSDMFLMPSRFEPCGLNQMYSQRYGTPPVVTQVGGLADTVTAATQENIGHGEGTGFIIEHLDKESLVETISRALAVYRNKPLWRSLMKNGMKKDFGWEKSAHQYLDLYQEMLKVF